MMMTMIPTLTYYNIAEGVTAFSTTRHGGMSQGVYGEFNINPYCGDASSAIATNRRLLADELGISEDLIFLPHQIHSTRNIDLTDNFLMCPKELRFMQLEGIDSITTACRGVCIGVSTADCIPVLLYDREHRCCAAVHAGWRGTVQRIVVKAIERMRAAYGTQPSELTAAIGPGISIDHFEVGDEVYQQFVDAGFEMEPISRRYQKWHIDLPECNRRQLIQLGVDPQRIISSGICTYAQSDMYFSARHLGIESGRIYNGIMLTPHRD